MRVTILALCLFTAVSVAADFKWTTTHNTQLPNITGIKTLSQK